MGFLDRLFGRKEGPQAQPGVQPYAPSGGGQPLSDDEEALRRYRYMLKTAPPEMIEQAHQEAFAKLTPSQRAQVLQELAEVTPERERTALAGGGRDDPESLARLATRAEMRQPGVMERIFGGRSTGTGMGGTMAGSIFGSLVGGFAGSMIAEEFFHSMGGLGFGEGDSGTQQGAEQTGYGAGDASSGDTTDNSGGYGDDSGGYSEGDVGGYSDDLGGDPGSDWGGGGDFGGGDW